MLFEPPVEELEVLSSFLHDAVFLTREVLIDDANGRVMITLDRIAYEHGVAGSKGKRRPRFFVRYPYVQSNLVFSSVRDPHWRWSDDAFNDPDDSHTLLSIDRDGDVVEILTPFCSVDFTVTLSTRIVLEDLSEPGPLVLTDYGPVLHVDVPEVHRLLRAT